MIQGKGSTTETRTVEDVQELIALSCDPLPLDGKRVLVIIPDGTRSAPIPLIFRVLYERLGRRVTQLDYLIALGTHPPMTEEAIERLVGVRASERADHYPNFPIFNHPSAHPQILDTAALT